MDLPAEKKPFNPEIAIGHKVKIYRNLHNGMWSIMDAKTRRVIGHTKSVVVTDATFPVNTKGVHKIRETRRKRVVAFVAGKFQGYDEDHECQQSVRFNPYEFFTFVDAHGYPVTIADKVNLTLNGWVWAVNPRVWPPYKDWILIP